MDYSPPGSFVHGILEWVAILFSRGSSQPRDRTQVFCFAGKLLTIWATREALMELSSILCSMQLKSPHGWDLFQGCLHHCSWFSLTFLFWTQISKRHHLLLMEGMMSKLSSPGADFPGRAVASFQYSEKDFSSCAHVPQPSSSLSVVLDSGSSALGPWGIAAIPLSTPHTQGPACREPYS